jgi:nucleoside-diphosphate-sugar epimerase
MLPVRYFSREAMMVNQTGESVLVTGGSGFLGGWCIIGLLNRGYRVRTTVRDIAREQEVRSALSAEVEAGDRLSFFKADLGDDGGWREAVAGCDYVLHVASPFPSKQPDNPDDLIVPARDGTLRVLRTSLDAGVKRIVVTSSVAAIRGSGKADSEIRTEEDWTDASNESFTPYTRSKTLAEQAAWKFMQDAGATDRLAVVNPGAILGPALSDDHSYSLELVERMLGGMPGMPRLGFSIVDVRDVADLEIAAMTTPGAGGERFIAAGQFLWMSDCAEILRERLGDAAGKVPSRKIPNFVVRAMARFDPGLRTVTGDLGRRTDYSIEKAKRMLGWTPRPVEQTVVDCARSLIDQSAVVAAR